MKRVWIFVGTGLLLLLLFAWWYLQHEWLTDELIAQIKVEMKKEEVEALLGKPEKGYTLPTWRDFDSLWWLDHAPISLVAPEKPWLPTLTTSGPAIHKNFSVVDGWMSGPRPEPPNLPVDSVWVGRRRVLILMISEWGVVSEIRAYPVTNTGGGFLSWLSRKYDDWMQGK